MRLSTRRDLREKTKKESDKTLPRGEGVVGKARGLVSSHIMIVNDLHPCNKLVILYSLC